MCTVLYIYEGSIALDLESSNFFTRNVYLLAMVKNIQIWFLKIASKWPHNPVFRQLILSSLNLAAFSGQIWQVKIVVAAVRKRECGNKPAWSLGSTFSPSQLAGEKVKTKDKTSFQIHFHTLPYHSICVRTKTKQNVQNEATRNRIL